MRSCSAAGMSWPACLVLQMKENMFVYYRTEQMLAVLNHFKSRSSQYFLHFIIEKTTVVLTYLSSG